MMRKALDDKFVNEFRTLRIDKKGSGFLYVDFEEWTNLLYKIERQYSAGCVIFVFITFLLFPLEAYIMRLIILATPFIALFYKLILITKYNNLNHWGRYQYEIYEDRIVRYSNAKYQQYYFEDFTRVEQKAFGSVLTKNRFSLNRFFLNPRKMNTLVLPKSVQGYAQIRDYIKSINNAQ